MTPEQFDKLYKQARSTIILVMVYFAITIFIMTMQYTYVISAVKSACK